MGVFAGCPQLGCFRSESMEWKVSKGRCGSYLLWLLWSEPEQWLPSMDRDQRMVSESGGQHGKDVCRWIFGIKTKGTRGFQVQIAYCLF